MYTAIIILNYNGAEDTINCVESIEKYNTANVKYIVVDNCSTQQNCVNRLNSYFSNNYHNNYSHYGVNDYKTISILPRMSLVVSDKNDGYACGNNIGLQFAYKDTKIDKILILNNDVLFVEDIIPGLIDDLKSIKDCGIISPILYKKNLEGIDYNCARREFSISHYIASRLLRILYKIKLFHSSSPYLLIGKDITEIKKINHIKIDLPSGSCMLIDKYLFKQIGGFDSNTFLYFEENILYKKIKNIGKQNYLSTQYKCIHLGASSTQKEPSYFIIKTWLESEAYYMKKYSGANLIQYMLYIIGNKLNLLFSYIIHKK